MSEPIPYATADGTRTKQTTVGFLLGVLGLGLIFLGGCFLVGVMMMQFGQMAQSSQFFSSPQALMLFLGVLYVLAFACCGGGIFVICIGVRRLLRN